MKKICWRTIFKKKAIIISVTALFVGVLVYCFLPPIDGMPLTLPQKKQIEFSWNREGQRKFPGWADMDSDRNWGLVSYGTHSGYTILLYIPTGQDCMDGSFGLGGYKFVLPSSSIDIYAYKNGEFSSLESVYGNNYLTKDDLANIYDAHQEFLRSVWPGLADK